MQFNAVPNLNAANIDFFAEEGSITSVAYLKTLQDNQPISLTGAVVTASNNELPNCFYVEDSDRTCGIKIAPSGSGSLPPVSENDLVTVMGTLATVSGERQITATSVSVTSTSATMPNHFG